jgi:hypothetical protein
MDLPFSHRSNIFCQFENPSERKGSGLQDAEKPFSDNFAGFFTRLGVGDRQSYPNE